MAALRALASIHTREEQAEQAALLTDVDVDDGADVRQEGALPAADDGTHQCRLDLPIGDTDEFFIAAVFAGVPDMIVHCRPRTGISPSLAVDLAAGILPTVLQRRLLLPYN